jgi:Putative Ig domain
MNDQLDILSPPRRRNRSRLGRLSVGFVGVITLTMSAIVGSAVVGLSESPAWAATAPSWAAGQYYTAIQNVPFCDTVSVASSTTLPLTSLTAGATPSGITGLTMKNVNLATGTGQECGTDTNAPASSGTPPALAPVATNSTGSATASIPIGSQPECTWVTTGGTVSMFDTNQDLEQAGSQSAFGQPITGGETAGTSTNYPTCTADVMEDNANSGDLGGAFTDNTANPLPTPTDTNPSASQGDLSSSNLELNSGCYGATEILGSYHYSALGTSFKLTVPSPWVNGGSCSYGGLGSNSAGGNTDTTNANCPPSQADVNEGYVACSIVISSGNDSNASVNYSTLDLFFNGQPVPQTPTATLSNTKAAAGGTLSVTGGTNWWGSSGGAPNSGPYGDFQSGNFYQVTAPSVFVGTSRATAEPAVSSTVTIPANTYVCTGAESSTVGPNPCTMTPGQPTGSFQLPSDLSPGNYNVYIDESNTTPLHGNGPNDSYQTTTGHTLGTVESTTAITIGTAPSITSANAATFTVGSAGTFTVSSTGFPNAALSEVGSLPSGVTFVDNGDGTATLSGTPAAGTGGSYPISITANNGFSPNATQSFTLTVDQAPAITSANHTKFTAGSAGTFSVTTSGTPKASLAEVGSLPSGVTFVDNGDGTATLSGTPAPGTGGSYPLSITATNGVSPDATQSFTLTVQSAPAITSGASTTFTVGSAGSFSVTSSGIPNAALSETGALPGGVSFVDNGNGTATLSGTPSAGTGGIYSFTITANNGVSPNATQSFTLTIDQAPAVTSAASTTFTEGAAGTFTVTSTGYPTAGLSETGALPGGVSFVDNGNGTATLSGTPAAATRGTYPITIKAANGVSPDGSQSFTLNVHAAPAITSANATTFTVGSAGTFTVTTSGIPAPALSETGALPGGVSFVDNGDGTATLSGTPAAGTGGVYPITVKASNGVSPNAAQSFTLTVDQAPGITSPAGTTFAAGVSSSFGVASSGYPAADLSETGTLPGGVSFVDNGDGTATISGTPTSGGSYPITITASNGVSPDATQSFILTVTTTTQAPSITSGNSTTFTVGSSGSFTVSSSGKPTPRLSESGTLPSGVSFSDNGDGTASLSGKPTSNGVYALTITASNGVSPDATQSFTLTVDQAPAVTSAASTTFTEGSAGTFTVSTSGYPTAALSEVGTLPAGVSFVDNGDGTATLSGTPAAGTRGTYTPTFKASNGVSPNATQSFTLTVDAAPAITSASSTTFTVGSSGSFTVITTGNPAATVSKTGSLPSGVSFVAHANGTATLSGTPAAGTGGTYPITITASNGVSPDATQSFTLTVDQAPAVTSANSTSFDEGSSNSFTVSTSGYPTAALSEVGTLPAGVSFVDNGDGTATLSGDPTEGGTFPITVKANNGVSPNASQSFTLTAGTAPEITSASSTTFAVGSHGTFTVTATGNPTPTITASGSLPHGVTFSGDSLSGTPTKAGTFQIGFEANNGISPQAVQYFTLTVTGLQITTTTLPTGSKGATYSSVLRTTGGTGPYAWKITTGSLPPGLKLNTKTGKISGKPTHTGKYTFNVQVKDSSSPKQTATAALTLTVKS